MAKGKTFADGMIFVVVGFALTFSAVAAETRVNAIGE